MNSEDALRLLLDAEFKDTIPENTGPIEGGIIYIHGEQLDPIKVLASDDDAYKNARSRWVTDKIADSRFYVNEIGGLKQGLIQSRIDNLSAMLNSGAIIPFVGSGMSANCGLPTWGDFLNSMRQESGISDRDYQNMLDVGNYENIATIISNNMNLNLEEEFMIHTFKMKAEGEVYGAIRLLPLLFEHTVITTNYDNVLERAYKKFNLGFDKVLSGSELKDYTEQHRIGTKILAKIHGNYSSIGTSSVGVKTQ